MTIKNNKKCILCGKTYTYCSRCEEFDHLPRWMEIYCSENCREIFNTLASYNAKDISAKEAAERLSKCDMSDRDKYHDVSKKLISEINSETSQHVIPTTVDIVIPSETISDDDPDLHQEKEKVEVRKPIRAKSKSK